MTLSSSSLWARLVLPFLLFFTFLWWSFLCCWSVGLEGLLILIPPLLSSLVPSG